MESENIDEKSKFIDENNKNIDEFAKSENIILGR
jgi:hypothetical protein